METWHERCERIYYSQKISNGNYVERGNYLYKVLKKVRRTRRTRDIQFYTHETADYVVNGYLFKNAIQFISTPTDANRKLTIPTKTRLDVKLNAKNLAYFYERSYAALCVSYRKLSIQEEEYLFMFEHLERFLEEYEIAQKQTFWYRIKRFLRGRF
jgi:hypothetical protein